MSEEGPMDFGTGRFPLLSDYSIIGGITVRENGAQGVIPWNRDRPVPFSPASYGYPARPER